MSGFIEHWRANKRAHWDDPTLREVPYCTCGRIMGNDEYTYGGGTFGRFDCRGCGRTYEVDISGVMWEDIETWT